MTTFFRTALAVVLAALMPCAAIAQSATIAGKPIVAPMNALPATASYCDDGTGRAISCPGALGGKQESFKLVAANIASAAATLFGGWYILSQACASYGTLTVKLLGPDGSNYVDVLVLTQADTTPKTFFLGSYAKVRIELSGTTGCNAIFSRVPA